MDAEEFDSDNVEETLDALNEKQKELLQLARFRSAFRVANEIRRLAKAEQRVIPYMFGCFTIMNNASDVLDPEVGRDAAMELISLLESEDRARAIQPDLPEAKYDSTVAWMSACAYDNLASNTAKLRGYNSHGMHECISDGILVCRRTGKLECLTCFREYATDVYRAADDLDMAMHFAREGIAHENPGPHDRRWVGAKDLAELLMLNGQFEAAMEAAERTWELAETFHTPFSAGLDTRIVLSELSHLLGEPQRVDRLLSGDTGSNDPSADSPDLKDPPSGEYPWHEMHCDQVAAVAECCAARYDAAIELLQKWDRVLTERHCLHDWFENRLRLLAAHRLAGHDREVQTLGRHLEEKAKPARDWLTLRRLGRILDSSVRPAPVPTVADCSAGLFATRPAVAVPSAEGSPDEQASADDARADSETPPEHTEEQREAPPPLIQEFWSRMTAAAEIDDEADSDAQLADILNDILAIDHSGVTTVEEACWLIHTVRYVIGDCSRGREIWEWAEAMAAPYLQDATALNLLATLGAALRYGPDPALEEMMSEERLERMFRESLDLDATRARNFSRAGNYFLFMENMGEAERCFARGFRLDRENGELAQKLADVYNRTDRAREALVVLDLCLRERCEDPDVAWEAALTAYRLDQFEPTLTYLDRCESLEPGRPWVNYYRASSLLELDRPAEALTAAGEEARRNPDCGFAPAMHRASALGALGRTEEFRDALSGVLEVRLAELEYVSFRGLCRLFERLWKSADCLSADDPLCTQLEDRVLATGLAPDELFNAKRKAGEAVEGVNFYECVVHQPLDTRWATWPGCLADESDWTSYTVTWGVLARSEEEARELVLGWQSRCYPLPPTIHEVTAQAETYTDSSGVVWQGYREGETADD